MPSLFDPAIKGPIDFGGYLPFSLSFCRLHMSKQSKARLDPKRYSSFTKPSKGDYGASWILYTI